MHSDEVALTIEQLADQVGVPVRTVRYYIAEGLVPGPGARGKAASYGQEHLLRLRLVRRLAEQRLPLSEVRERVGALSHDEVRALLAEEERNASEIKRAAAAPAPKDYVSALLRRAQQARTAGGTTGGGTATKSAVSLDSAAPYQELREQGREGTEGTRWQRMELAPGVELHVREDAQRRERELIQRVARAARRE